MEHMEREIVNGRELSQRFRNLVDHPSILNFFYLTTWIVTCILLVRSGSVGVHTSHCNENITAVFPNSNSTLLLSTNDTVSSKMHAANQPAEYDLTF